jgi:hypothetical protein
MDDYGVKDSWNTSGWESTATTTTNGTREHSWESRFARRTGLGQDASARAWRIVEDRSPVARRTREWDALRSDPNRRGSCRGWRVSERPYISAASFMRYRPLEQPPGQARRNVSARDHVERVAPNCPGVAPRCPASALKPKTRVFRVAPNCPELSRVVPRAVCREKQGASHCPAIAPHCLARKNEVSRAAPELPRTVPRTFERKNKVSAGALRCVARNGSCRVAGTRRLGATILVPTVQITAPDSGDTGDAGSRGAALSMTLL